MAVVPKFTGLLPTRSGDRPAAASAKAMRKHAAAPAKAMRKPATRPTQQNDDPRNPMPPLHPRRSLVQYPIPSGSTYAEEEARARREQTFRSALFSTTEDRLAESGAAWQRAQEQREEEQRQAEGDYALENVGSQMLNSYIQRTTANPLRVLSGRGYDNDPVFTPPTPPPSTGNPSVPTFGQRDDFSRSGALMNVTGLTQQEYEALSPRQQAAIQFNTGLVAAARSDHATRTGSTENTEAFLESVGITPDDERDLNRYLNLEYLISPETIALMDDPANGVQTPTSSLGHVPGEITPSQQLVSDAREHSVIIGNILSNRLATSGSGTLTGESTPLPGFGNTVEDAMIQDIYLQMIDSSKNWTTEDIVAGIAADNAAMGTNVTPEQVWDFTRANIESVELGSLGSRQEQLRGSGVNLATGIELTPLDIAEIRARYGL